MLDLEGAAIAERFGLDVELDKIPESLARNGGGVAAVCLRTTE